MSDFVFDRTNGRRTSSVSPRSPAASTIRDQLAANGFDAETEIFNNDRGSRFFLRAPGGVMVEFTTRADAAEEFRGTFN